MPGHFLAIPEHNQIDKNNPTCKTYIQKDSSLVQKYLDSIPQVIFPYYSKGWNREEQRGIDLSCFKDKFVFNLRYKRIPTEIDGGRIDISENDTVFDLTDSNFIARWNLIARTQVYFVIEFDDGNNVKLATLKYDLTLIDAINSSAADPLGNANYRAFRYSYIYSDLSILIHHYFEGRNFDGCNIDKTETEEKWQIDKQGYFIKVGK